MKNSKRRFCCLPLTGGLLFAFITILSAGQANPSPTVKIPFNFWIGARQLPPGEYVIDHVAGPDVLLFRSKDEKHVEQVFLIPARGPVVESAPKLVFIVRDGRCYLSEFWGAQGKRLLTAQYKVQPQAGDITREVSIQR